MASSLSQAFTGPPLRAEQSPNASLLHLHHHHHSPKLHSLKCYAHNKNNNPAANTSSNNSSPPTKQKNNNGEEPENVVLKLAWYASELLGIAASVFRSPAPSGAVADDEFPARFAGYESSGAVDRAAVVESIKQDFERSYFVTGNLTMGAYEDDCEFADPAGSFKGLRRFKRNCTNFGSLLQKSNMKLMKWEDFEEKGIGHWRFSCILSFPWKPILSVFTEFHAPSVGFEIICSPRFADCSHFCLCCSLTEIEY